jgi:hypothetical protein
MSFLIDLDDAVKDGIFSNATRILLKSEYQPMLPEITFTKRSLVSECMITYSVSKIPTVSAGKYNTRVRGSVGGFVPMGQVVCSKCRTKQYKNSDGLPKKHLCIEKC